MKTTCKTKIKSINDRPMIVITSSTSSWTADYNDCSHKFELHSKADRNKIVTPKKDTLKTGIFQLFIGPYGNQMVARSGKILSYFDYYKNPEPLEFKNVNEIFKILKEKVPQGLSRNIIIKRTLLTYTNSETHESTKDKKIAKSWFKDRNPLWVSARQEQQIGFWVEDGGDHVEISTWYNNKISKGYVEKWQKADQSFWLYPDGTISHFWKGKYFDTNRTFCTERVRYNTFDHRFRELYTSQYIISDLKAEDISRQSDKHELLGNEVKQILKKVGFPKFYWSWGDSKREIKKAFDLLNLAHFKQKGVVSQKQAKLQNNVEEIAFNPNNKATYIIEQDNGILFRIPRVAIYYIDEKGTVGLESWVMANPRIQSIDIIEGYRLWIRKDGKKATCLKAIHDGQEWSTGTIGDLEYLSFEPIEDRTYHGKTMTLAEIERYNSLTTTCKNVFETIKRTIIEKITFYSYYPKNITKETSWKELLTFAECFKKAPSLLDTLIKTGNIDLLKNNYSSTYSLDNIFNIYAIKSGEYKENKKGKLWGNLKVSKEQFYFGLEKPTFARQIFFTLRYNSIVMPIKVGTPAFNPNKAYRKGDIVQFGYSMWEKVDDFFGQNNKRSPKSNNIEDLNSWREVCYPQKDGKTILSEIPMKYINLIYDMFGKVRNIDIYDFKRLISYNEISLTELEIIHKRGLPVYMLRDYWHIIQNIGWNVGQDVSDKWERIPKTQESLQQLHDEANLRLRLAREEAAAKAAKAKEEKDRTNTAKYAKYLKMLKDFVVEDEKFIVVVPETLGEIVDEGARMSHCVGSYTDRVANGETFVFFLRKKENVNQCYVTFNIDPANSQRRHFQSQGKHKWLMDQAFAAHDHKAEPEAIAFLRNWAEKKDVDFSTIARQCI